MIKVAFMYDFDKTLSPKDMQEFGFLPSLGFDDPKKFWEEVSAFKDENEMDGILAYMHMMIEKSEQAGKPVRREDLVALGKGVELFPGVKDWFQRVNEEGKKLGLDVEHYIISSGLTEIIEGTEIADCFKKIYACRYYYDEQGVAKWPALVVNYTTKTQYIFRINKQVLNAAEDVALNQYTDVKERPISISNMVYIGDGLTDVPCMKLVKQYGGHSIAVYHPQGKKSQNLAKELVSAERVHFTAPADYSQGSIMETLAFAILKEIAARAELDHLAQQNVK